jgi:transcriptional regulator with XRE-family HTH domain
LIFGGAVQDADRESIGGLIARVRDENGVTQLRLAARLCACAGVSTITRHEISRWEREERIPSGYWLAWLAVALDVPLGDLERAAAVARRRRPRRRVEARGRDRRRWGAGSDGVYDRKAS